jgi:hypothetical protein
MHTVKITMKTLVQLIYAKKFFKKYIHNIINTSLYLGKKKARPYGHSLGHWGQCP